MAVPSWFNENENRDYPFVTAFVDLPPRNVLVDCGFVTNVKSRFETGVHTVKLVAIRRQGFFFYFDFVSDAPELYGIPLVFSRQTSDDDFTSEFVTSGSLGLSESSESGSGSANALCDEPLWRGFIVVGRISALESLLPGDGELVYDATVEPALLQNLAESYVSKFGLANADRTRVTAPSGCADPVEAEDDVIFVKHSCIRGNVVFRAGYNANVRQSSQDNSITLGASVGAGEGEPCEPITLYTGEVPPDDSELLGGGPRCNDTIRAINGIGGPLFNFVAGAGVAITALPEENKIIVNVDMGGLTICAEAISYRSESC